MNKDQALSIVRAILNMAGVWLLKNGYADNSGVEAIAGLSPIVVSLAWSWFHHGDKNAPSGTAILWIAPLLLLTLPGCVSHKGWQGLIPDKDVEIINPRAVLNTPWGSETLSADRIATRYNPAGTNAVGAQSLPVLVNSTNFIQVPISSSGAQFIPAMSTNGMIAIPANQMAPAPVPAAAKASVAP